MATSINLGPLLANHPLPVERTEMRKQLGLGTSSILNATFSQTGAGDITLNLSDQTNPTFSIDLSKTRLVDTTSIRLLNPRKIYLDDSTIYTGNPQIEKAVAAGNITATGNAKVTITSANFNGANKDRVISVPVQLNDTPSLWANKVRGALNANEDVIALFNVSGTNANIILTNKRARAQDATLNIKLENDSCAGIATALLSVNEQTGTVTESIQLSDIKTPLAHIAQFDGTGELKIVGMLQPDVVLRRHIKEWDVAQDGYDTNTGNASGISTRHIQHNAVEPAKLSVGAPTWDTKGDTAIIKNLEVQGGQVLVEGRSAGIATTSDLVQGSGYVQNTYYDVVLVKTGNGASTFAAGSVKADIVVVAGKVTSVSITDRGTGFSGTDIVLTAPNTSLGGSGSGFSIKVATLTDSTNGGRLVLAGQGQTGLSAHDKDNSWQLISVGASPGDFEIQSAITGAITAIQNDTNVGLRIKKSSGEVQVVSLRSQGVISASKVTISGTPATASGTNNDFDGIAASARIWTNTRTISAGTITGNTVNHVTFSFSLNGSADVTVPVKINDSVIVNSMITDADTATTNGIATAKIQNKAITSGKLENDITIAGTLKVQKKDATLGNRGIKFDSDDACRITANGNDLEIVTSGSIKFGTNGTSNGFVNKASINNAGDLTCVKITASGKISTSSSLEAAGDVIAYTSSDVNLKYNIKNIQTPLEKIKRLNGVSFTWNSLQDTYTGYDLGIIAQEVEEVFPEIVTTRENGFKAVKYERLIPLLIECVKELKTLNDELVQRLENYQKIE